MIARLKFENSCSIHGDGIQNSRLKQIFELSMRLGDSIVSAVLTLEITY